MDNKEEMILDRNKIVRDLLKKDHNIKIDLKIIMIKYKKKLDIIKVREIDKNMIDIDKIGMRDMIEVIEQIELIGATEVIDLIDLTEGIEVIGEIEATEDTQEADIKNIHKKVNKEIDNLLRSNNPRNNNSSYVIIDYTI